MNQLIGYLSEGEQLKGSLTIPKQLGGSTLGSKIITANGVYDATDDGVDGYDVVTANVPNTYAAGDEGKVVDNGALVSQTTATYTINNTYDTTKIKSVTVNVGGGSPTLETITKTYTPTTSQQTEQITPSSGYDGIGEVDVTVNAMPSGTEGTPTATKGAVSNHSVAVTPSVTNQAGYIAGGTKTGTAVTVSASELDSGTKSITANGNNQDVVGYAAVDVAVPNSYSAADEGKVVSSGALVAQTSDTVTANDTYDTTLINSLTVNVPSSGGGDEDPELKDVVFVDYDGEVVYNYTAQEFLALNSMPSNPSHSGLVAQGWNWSLADAKEYVTANGMLVVGQNYTTSDGKTRIYITVDDCTVGIPFKLTFSTSVKGGATIDWGDGNTTVTTGNANATTQYDHNYNVKGDYMITIDVTSGTFTPQRNLAGRSFFGPNAETPPNIVKKIEFGDNVTGLGSDAICNCRKLKTISVSRGLSSYTGGCCLNNPALKCFVIPSGAAGWTSGAPFTSTRLKFLSIPKNCAINNGYISDESLPALRMITLPTLATLTTNRVLYSACLVEKVAIPGTYTTISGNFLRNCLMIRKVTIPSTVTSIAQHAFTGMFNIREYHFLPTTPPTLASTSNMFTTTYSPKIYVPYSADHSILNAYKTATNWSSFASYIEEEPQ